MVMPRVLRNKNTRGVKEGERAENDARDADRGGNNRGAGGAREYAERAIAIERIRGGIVPVRNGSNLSGEE